MAPPGHHPPPPPLPPTLRGPPQIDGPRFSGRVTKYVVTPWTASKIALASFAIGVLVGYQLNRSIRRLAARLLHKIQKE